MGAVQEFAGRTGVPIETAESWLAGKKWPKQAHIALQIMRELRAKRSGSFYDSAKDNDAMDLDEPSAKSWTSKTFEAFVRDKLFKGDLRSILIAMATKATRSVKFHEKLSIVIRETAKIWAEDDRKRRERQAERARKWDASNRR